VIKLLLNFSLSVNVVLFTNLEEAAHIYVKFVAADDWRLLLDDKLGADVIDKFLLFRVGPFIQFFGSFLSWCVGAVVSAMTGLAAVLAISLLRSCVTNLGILFYLFLFFHRRDCLVNIGAALKFVRLGDNRITINYIKGSGLNTLVYKKSAHGVKNYQ
jgi:hypothetical protein